MTTLDNIVQVDITRQTSVPTRTGFGTPLIIDENVIQTNRVDSFSSITSMIEFGFSPTSEAVKAATKLLSQERKVATIKVGRRDADVNKVVTVTIDTVLDTTLYTVTINGVDFDFTSDGDALDTEIRDGLVSAINGGAEPVTAAPGASNTLTLTADDPLEDFTTAVTAEMSFVVTAAAVNILTEYAAIKSFDNDFYFVLSTDKAVASILALAGAVEADIKLYGFSSDDADSKDLAPAGDTTSLFGQLKALGYDRTFGVWTKTSNLDNYPEAAWIGLQATKQAGATTWKFRSVTGVLPDDELSETERSNITGPVDSIHKNGNLYLTIGGVAVFLEGIVFSGEFIDIIRGTDFLRARIQEAVYGALINEEKIPFDNGGIAQITLQIESVLLLGEGLTILAAGSSVVSAPDIADVPVADRAARFLNNVTFDARYAGAIHKTAISGTITV